VTDDLGRTTWPETEGRPWLLVPVGSVEQHGPALPLTTDTIVAEAVTREAAARLRAAGRSVLIAPAVDFTEELMWKRFPPEIKREIERTGAWARPSQYSDQPYLVTRGLIEEGRSHLLLDNMIETGCPVRILQGVQDPDVPWQHAVELSSRFAQDDVVLTLVKDGDHRLSRPEDIERLIAAVAEF